MVTLRITRVALCEQLVHGSIVDLVEFSHLFQSGLTVNLNSALACSHGNHRHAQSPVAG
jgi:hypothetical protein